MYKFTPGPWKTIDNRILSDKYLTKTPIATVHKRQRDQQDANARLISAAPEMYEVLHRIQSLIDSGDWQLPKGFCETEIAWIQDALTKARTP